MAFVIMLVLASFIGIFVSFFVLFFKKFYYSAISLAFFLSPWLFIFGKKDGWLPLQLSDQFYQSTSIFILLISAVCFPVALFFDIRKKRQNKNIH